ncbi:adenylate/guanylate cyclase domain-containing protein [Dehalococcoides mccartyi]|nr:adenylate/guanylate cyclase domain-containing protein [Dehalococcoides mccartyi]
MFSKIILGFAADSEETSSERSEKNTIFLIAISCCIAGIMWGSSYVMLLGWGETAVLPFLFTLVVGSSLVISHATKKHHYAVYAQTFSIIIVTVAIQWTIGGMFDSGVVIVWATIGPLGALLFFSPKKSIPAFALFFVGLAITIGLDPYFTERGLEVSETFSKVFFALNLGVSSLLIFVFSGYFVRAAIQERSKADRLLLNVLPAEIAETLKESDETIARHYDSVSVLFADVVGSTPLFADLEPVEVVDWLNEVFSVLDDLVERHGLEKLRTMGDGYMVGSGVPGTRDDHSRALVACSLDMIEALKSLPPRNGKQMTFRFGINSGPVVAGVIGKSKFHYDLWGDTVNVASRMESYSEESRLHISQNTYELIKDDFDCVSRGMTDIKGKGEMQTWFVEGPRVTA